jgi:hypothetical protein
MGIRSSRVSKSYKNIKIPKKYKVIKVATFNINVRNSIGLSDNIIDIVRYIFNDVNSKHIDIICLHGIHDTFSLEELIKGVNKYAQLNDIEIHTLPEFKEMEDIRKKRTKKSTMHLPSIIASTKHNDYGIKYSDSVILSRHKIRKYFMDTTIGNDIYPDRNYIVANIEMYGKIISIYNISLSSDIGIVDSKQQREKELTLFDDLFLQNIQELDELGNKDTSVHLLLSALNINEISDKMPNEYVKFVDKYNAIDLYRCHNIDGDGFTTAKHKRHQYMFLILTKDILDKKSKYHDAFVNAQDQNDLMKVIIRRYKFHILEIGVTELDTSGSNYPVECIFILKF